MTKRRDPDIMAMERAIRAIRKSTDRMLPHNIDFIIPILERLKREAQDDQADWKEDRND